MEDAFDPFGLDETESALQAQQQTTTNGTAPDALSHSPDQVAGFDAGDDGDAFDPFGIGKEPAPATTKRNILSPPSKEDNSDSGEESPPEPPAVSRILARSTFGKATSVAALPPKMNVKLSIHEEVSSKAYDGDGASDVSIEGDVHVQVQCSDALKNAPFNLTACLNDSESSTKHQWKLTTTEFSEALSAPKTKTTPNPQQEVQQQFLVSVPKHEIGMVPSAHYSITATVQHMPLLLERKVMISGTNCRVAVQVRSKLSNLGNLQDFTIAVAVPEAVNGDSISIVRGDGYYDELKRTIHWKMDELERGNSFMVSAQLSLWEEGRELSFPVMLRCLSQFDQIGDADFQVTAADGHPASVTYTTTSRSFRLLHRLA